MRKRKPIRCKRCYGLSYHDKAVIGPDNRTGQQGKKVKRFDVYRCRDCGHKQVKD